MTIKPAKKIFKPIVLLMCITVLLFNTACTAEIRSDERISETRLLLDTYVTITIHGNVDPGLLNEAFLLCEELEGLLSMTLEGSDIWRINHAGGEPVRIDPRTIEVIEAGLLFGEISNGKFDITIGRLSRLWDFGGLQHVPSDDEINEAKATVDFRQIIIEAGIEVGFVQLINPDARIDLGAVAKGYIAGRIADHLTAAGVTGALIDMGGDVVAVGGRPGGDPWRVALRKPFGDAGEYLGIIEVYQASVLASGVYERQFNQNGLLYHHILDPETGHPVISDVVSATVLTENAVFGEGLSTIAVLVGSEEAKNIFDGFQGFIGAVLVSEDGNIIEIGNIKLMN